MRKRRSLAVLFALTVAYFSVTVASSPASAAVVEPPVLFGIYSSGTFFNATGPNEVQAINNWLGDPSKHMSIVGTFMDPEFGDANAKNFNIPTELEAIWDSGAVPFVNLTVGTTTPGDPPVPLLRTAAEVASGLIDGEIQDWADAYKSWATGTTSQVVVDGPRRAFIAPLQEMNGYWPSYGEDAVNFIAAYERIQNIFAARGVPTDSVSWVFAPNGWSNPGHEFENYYPGNSRVDVVAISAYNFGTCVWQFPSWDTFEIAFEPFLDRMRAMAPSKPIFLAQTGSVNLGGDKSAWLDESFTKLAAYPALRGIIYFHKLNSEGLPCDPVEWRFYFSDTNNFPGIRTAILRPAAGFGHWDPTASEWTTIAFAPGPGGNTFEDVERAHPFAGVEDVWYYAAVESVAAAGLTSGYPDGTYRPNNSVTRAEMAIFILKGIHGSIYSPPTPAGGVFSDTAGHWAESWIEDLFNEGITSGYPDGSYRPENNVTRAEMAVFLLRAKHGSGYTPPAPLGGVFSDIGGHWAEAWIEQLQAEGFTSGYPDGTYRPQNTVSRAEMAAFLVTTFSLP